jgi:hypothetical protein
MGAHIAQSTECGRTRKSRARTQGLAGQGRPARAESGRAMNGNRHRLVALRLHKLAALDRKWILDRLPAADRSAVAAYLSELKEFRIDEETLESVENGLPAPVALEAVTTHRGQPHIVEHVLSHEPGWLRHALRLDDEPYADAGAPMLTGKARKSLAKAFQRQVQMLEEKRMAKLSHGAAGISTQAKAPQSSFLTRLGNSWRR